MSDREKRLLVTGGAGFIGCNFVCYWLGEHPDSTTVVLDALTYAGRRENLADVENHTSFTFVEGNICDQALVEDLLIRHRINTIVHLAAESHVDRSIAGPDIFVETNIVGTHSLLKAARRVWSDKGFEGCRFHHVSTDEVYGSLGPDDPPFSEDSSYAPNSPYAASKAASDHLVRAYWKTYGLPVGISNCSNNFGPYQNPEKLIPLFVKNSLLGRPLPLYGDGSQRRDWLHVDEHCRALELILSAAPVGRSYNIGGHCEMSNLSLVTAVCNELDALMAESPALCESFPDAPPCKGGKCIDLLHTVDDRPGHDRRYAISGDRIHTELGFEPVAALKGNISRSIEWMLKNVDFWRDAG